MKENWIVIAGNPADGFAYYGPFESAEAANELADQHRKALYGDEEFWVVKLEDIGHAIAVAHRKGC